MLELPITPTSHLFWTSESTKLKPQNGKKFPSLTGLFLCGRKLMWSIKNYPTLELMY